MGGERGGPLGSPGGGWGYCMGLWALSRVCSRFFRRCRQVVSSKESIPSGRDWQSYAFSPLFQNLFFCFATLLFNISPHSPLLPKCQNPVWKKKSRCTHWLSSRLTVCIDRYNKISVLIFEEKAFCANVDDFWVDVFMTFADALQLFYDIDFENGILDL